MTTPAAATTATITKVSIPWQSCIPLRLADPVRKSEIPNFSTISAKDVCAYIDQNQKYHGWRMYFDKETFPDQEKETLTKLEDYIINTAKLNGTVFHRGGFYYNGKTKKTRRICCCYNKFDKKIRKIDPTAKDRDPDFIQCNFRINLEWDETYGWYVPIHSRTATHHSCLKNGKMHDHTSARLRMGHGKVRAPRAKKEKKAPNQAAVLREKNDNNDGPPLVAGNLAQIFEDRGVVNTSLLPNAAIGTVQKRSYLDAYQTLNPLLVEMLNISNADPSMLPYFRDVMQQAISNCQLGRTMIGTNTGAKRRKTSY